MNIVDRIISQIVALQISLYHDVLRLDEETDARAIHDLHIDLMRLRGALRPFRRMSQMMSIDDASAHVIALTASVETLQGLVTELRARGYLTQAEWKQALLTNRNSTVKDSVALASFMSELDGAVRSIRSVADSLGKKGFKSRVAMVLFKQRRNLQVALQIKHPVGWRTASRIRDFRYLIEAYPNMLTITPDTKRALHAAQTQLDNAQRLDH